MCNFDQHQIISQSRDRTGGGEVGVGEGVMSEREVCSRKSIDLTAMS